MKLGFVTLSTILGAAHAGSLRGTPVSRDLEPQRANNIGEILRGYDILEFSTLETPSDTNFKRAFIFEADFSDGHTTADGRFAVPAGLEASAVESCVLDAGSSLVTGETSLNQTETNGVQFGFGANDPSGVNGTFQSSATFRNVRESSSSDQSDFIFTRSICTLHQLSLQRNNMPSFSTNFLNGLMGLRDEPSDSKEYYKFLGTFGTHYLAGGSLGSTLIWETRRSRQQTRDLVQSGMDLNVTAALASQEANANIGFTNSQQRTQIETFMKETTGTRNIVVGNLIPIGNTQQEVIQSWRNDLRTSGIDIVSNWRLIALPDVFGTFGALERINNNIPQGFDPLTANELATIQTNLGIALARHCEDRFGADSSRCNGPLEDPEPLQPDEPLVVRKRSTPVRRLNNNVGTTRTIGDHSQIAGLLGIPEVNSDVMLTQLHLTFVRRFGFPNRVSSIRAQYRDSENNIATTASIGNVRATTCTINIPYGTEIRTVEWQDDNAITGLRLLDAAGKRVGNVCGNFATSGVPGRTRSEKIDGAYFWGFQVQFINNAGAHAAIGRVRFDFHKATRPPSQSLSTVPDGLVHKFRGNTPCSIAQHQTNQVGKMTVRCNIENTVRRDVFERDFQNTRMVLETDNGCEVEVVGVHHWSWNGNAFLFYPKIINSDTNTLNKVRQCFTRGSTINGYWKPK